MTYWEGPSRWINTALIVIVSFVGLDTLFRLLQARQENVIVGAVHWVASIFLFPFRDMFLEQHYLLTAIIALLGYSVLAVITLAVVRSVQASRRQNGGRSERVVPSRPSRPPTPYADGPRSQAGDETRRL